MSKYEDKFDDEGYKCPYCGYKTVCDDWGFDYDGVEEECCECGKKFYATASHSISFESEPDCELNGDEHDLRFDDVRDCYFCKTCGKCVLKEDVSK